MANPKGLHRPPAGQRYDPTAIDATGATLGHVLTAVSDGSGGQRAGYAAPAAPTTAAWMPLTTVVGGVPELVWDANDSLIPTYTPLG